MYTKQRSCGGAGRERRPPRGAGSVAGRTTDRPLLCSAHCSAFIAQMYSVQYSSRKRAQQTTRRGATRCVICADQISKSHRVETRRDWLSDRSNTVNLLMLLQHSTAQRSTRGAAGTAALLSSPLADRYLSQLQYSTVQYTEQTDEQY